MKKLYLFILTPFLISCSITGLTSDYNKLSEREKEAITSYSLEENYTDKKVYRINGIQLLAEIKKHPKALVYEFTNGCISATCYPLVIFENYAKENNYKLFLVMNGYNNIKESLAENINTPLFSIDEIYYESKFRNKYIKKFTKDLLSEEPNTEEILKEFYGGIYLFENGKLTKTERDLKNLLNQA